MDRSVEDNRENTKEQKRGNVAESPQECDLFAGLIFELSPFRD